MSRKFDSDSIFLLGTKAIQFSDQPQDVLGVGVAEFGALIHQLSVSPDSVEITKEAAERRKKR